MQDRPTIDELLDAVEIFLRDTVVEELKGQPRFHARVAANAIAIVRRELAADAGFGAEETDRLTALVGEGGGRLELNERLAAMVGDGVEMDEAAVLEHLRQTVREKLAVANPKYRAEPGRA